MAEILFILVTVYAVYVVQRVIAGNDEAKQSEKDSVKRPQDKAQATDNNKKSVTVREKAVVKKEKTIEKNTKMPTGNLRDPVTGEEATIANSYRMLRRWIKEALVKEGLVEKIYKTNELDSVTVEKINKAVVKLKNMDKYQ